MKPLTLFVTGTDTGVGKTVVASLIAGQWRREGLCVAALKPVCSGGRSDARLLRDACGRSLTLEEVNPWSFKAPLSPLLASRREGRPLRKRAVLGYLKGMQRRFPFLVIEGAGGLRSPLGEDFDSRDLLLALGAIPVAVCPNRLGAINQCLLVLDALPPRLSRRAQVVLVTPRRLSAASRTNPELLGELIGPDRVHVLPWLHPPRQAWRRLPSPRVRRFLRSIRRNR